MNAMRDMPGETAVTRGAWRPIPHDTASAWRPSPDPDRCDVVLVDELYPGSWRVVSGSFSLAEASEAETEATLDMYVGPGADGTCLTGVSEALGCPGRGQEGFETGFVVAALVRGGVLTGDARYVPSEEAALALRDACVRGEAAPPVRADGAEDVLFGDRAARCPVARDGGRAWALTCRTEADGRHLDAWPLDNTLCVMGDAVEVARPDSRLSQARREAALVEGLDEGLAEAVEDSWGVTSSGTLYDGKGALEFITVLWGSVPDASQLTQEDDLAPWQEPEAEATQEQGSRGRSATYGNEEPWA